MFKKGKGRKRARGRGIGRHRRDCYDSHGLSRPHKRSRTPVFNRTVKGTTISPSVKHSEADLRDAIKTMYCRHGSPARADWRSLGTVADIADALRCSDATVLKVLTAIDVANSEGNSVDVRSRNPGTGGHNKKIVPGTGMQSNHTKQSKIRSLRQGALAFVHQCVRRPASGWSAG